MQAVKDELHNAAESVNKAGKAAYDKIVDPGVRGHLRDATRHLLKAAKCAVEAAEKHFEDKTAPSEAPQPINTVVVANPAGPQG
jgi:hypothetical protein